MKIYKKNVEEDVLIKCIGEDNNYSIASQKDPDPDCFINHVWGQDVGEWIEISADEAEDILGYIIF